MKLTFTVQGDVEKTVRELADAYPGVDADAVGALLVGVGCSQIVNMTRIDRVLRGLASGKDLPSTARMTRAERKAAGLCVN